MNALVAIAALNILSFGNYTVSYNYTIGFANYAASIHSERQICDCGGLSNNWTDSANYTCLDYSRTFYHRGRLAPLGCEMSNVVPMTPQFHNGPWRKIEHRIQKHYSGYLVFKGCEYGEKLIITATNKTMRIPDGCYYVVLNSTKLTYHGYIIEHGYVGMNSSAKHTLPWWVSPMYEVEKPPQYVLWAPGGALLVVGICVSLMLIISHRLV